MPLTVRQFRALRWTQAFQDEMSGLAVFQAEGMKNVAIVHEWMPGKKTRIRYRVCGRWADGPSEAVRIYNAAENGRADGRRHAPRSP